MFDDDKKEVVVAFLNKVFTSEFKRAIVKEWNFISIDEYCLFFIIIVVEERKIVKDLAKIRSEFE